MRPLHLFVAVLALALALVLFLGGPRSADGGIAAPGTATGDAPLAQAPAVAPPGTSTAREGRAQAAAADAEPPDPTPATTPEPAEPELPFHQRSWLQLPEVEVYAFTPAGEPLVAALGARLGDLRLAAHASIAPPPKVLPPAELTAEHEASAARVTVSSQDEAYVATLGLRVDPPLWVALQLGRHVLAAQPLGAGVERLEFRVPVDDVLEHLGALTFRIVDGETGDPRPFAHALLTAQAADLVLSRSADAEGRLTVEPWPVGPAAAQVWAEGYGFSWFELETLSGGPTDAGDLELWPALQLRGRMLDPDGQPLPHVDVQYVCEGPPRSLMIGGTGDDGSFALEVQPGRWQLQPFPPEEYPAHAFPTVLVEVERGAPPPFLEVRLEPGGPLTLEAAEPWARRATFRLADAEGRLVRWGNLLYTPSWRTQLPFGDYSLELVDAGGEPLRRAELAHGAAGTHVALDRL